MVKGISIITFHPLWNWLTECQRSTCDLFSYSKPHREDMVKKKKKKIYSSLKVKELEETTSIVSYTGLTTFSGNHFHEKKIKGTPTFYLRDG